MLIDYMFLGFWLAALFRIVVMYALLLLFEHSDDLSVMFRFH